VSRSIAAAAAASLALAGCHQLDYLLQAGEGQLDLLCRARSIESQVDNENLDPETRRLLAEVPQIKAFAKRKGLVPTHSYEDFVDLERPYVVWVVSAAPALSLEPRKWSFPIVGSVPYLGWFDKTMARQAADQLATEGWDVDMRGSTAYSTLGWFSDPVLSSMIQGGPDADGELADTILHESVHATLYIPGQSEFNEGLATFVGDRLCLSYLAERFGPQAPQLTEWVDGERSSKVVQERLHAAHQHLRALYASKQPDAEKLEQKRQYLTALRAELRFRRPITNATLAGYATYHGGTEDFERLLAFCDGDVSAMVEVAKTIKPADFSRPQQADLGPIIAKLGPRCAELQRKKKAKASPPKPPTASPSP